MANKRAKGIRSRTRRKLKRNVREKTTVNEIMKPVSIGDAVQIKINSSFHPGLPHPRMHGKGGLVIGFQGNCPVIQLKDGNKSKKVIAHRAHIKKLLQIPKEVKE